MNQGAPIYFSYLLRIWRVADGEQPVWCASLENPVSGERCGFATLEELFAFLPQCLPTTQLRDDRVVIPRRALGWGPVILSTIFCRHWEVSRCKRNDCTAFWV